MNVVLIIIDTFKTGSCGLLWKQVDSNTLYVVAK